MLRQERGSDPVQDMSVREQLNFSRDGKGRHFNVVYQNAPFNLMAWCLFMANQKNSREYLSKHFLIRLNRDLAVDASRNIRIIIGPGLRRFQRLKLGNHR